MNANAGMNAGARVKLLCAAVVSAAVLSACGGGGSTSMTMTNPTTPPASAPPADFASALTGRVGDIQGAMAEAARSRPRFGSVTQSSNVDGGVTRDRVGIETTRGSGGAVTYTLSGSLGGDDAFRLQGQGQGEPVGERGEYQVELRDERTVGGTPGTLFVRAITTFEAPPSAGAANANYLSAGYWAFLPNERTAAATGSLSFGAFADGTDPFEQANLGGLTGTATYTGGAGGVFVLSAGENTQISPFGATVSLTADFSDGSALGSISGSISEVEDSRGNELGAVVTLQSADIGAEDSGFFTGTTAMTFGDDDATYSGSWGGHFLGNGAAATDQPEGVVGTFGATTIEGQTPTRSLVGAFAARRSDSP